MSSEVDALVMYLGRIADLQKELEQVRAELTTAKSEIKRFKTTRVAWIDNEELLSELALANEVIEAARQWLEFESDRAAEDVLRKRILKWDARKK